MKVDTHIVIRVGCKSAV